MFPFFETVYGHASYMDCRASRQDHTGFFFHCDQFFSQPVEFIVAHDLCHIRMVVRL